MLRGGVGGVTVHKFWSSASFLQVVGVDFINFFNKSSCVCHVFFHHAKKLCLILTILIWGLQFTKITNNYLYDINLELACSVVAVEGGSSNKSGPIIGFLSRAWGFSATGSSRRQRWGCILAPCYSRAFYLSSTEIRTPLFVKPSE